ncbi:hypothetical protein [Pseudoxanthomonas sp. CF125]|uniref:hypothetical protein n=1 Tax=Pseudoxanthomonas sp. CF125 TaxID=1855303 RepID=UPI000B85E91E|nr:hypothetical protein [Pseudoxanthomonas sp. CF125]
MAAILTLLALTIMLPKNSRAEDKKPTETEALNASNEKAKARYGEPATPKTGAITNADKLGNMALVLQPDAYKNLAKLISIPTTIKKPQNLVITGRPNLGILISTAEQVKLQVEDLVLEGNKLAKKLDPKYQSIDCPSSPPDPQATFGSLTMASVLAIAGAVEGLVGLFRTDYSIGSNELDANEIGLKLAIRKKLGTGYIDGLDLYMQSKSDFGKCLQSLSSLRNVISQGDSKADSPYAKFIAATDTIVAALSKPGESGISPAAQIALLIEMSKAINDGGGVLYVSAVKPTGYVITTSRLFNKNGKAHLYYTGLVNVAFLVPGDGLQGINAFRLGEKASLDLGRLHKATTSEISITTSVVE